jgi:hypothetical protein
VDYDVDETYGYGMRIHPSISVQNLKGRRCCVVAFFFSGSGEQLCDFNGKFKTNDGYVAVSTDVIPPYDTWVFNNIYLSIPYGELHLADGYHDLKFYVGLYSYDMNSYLAISNWEYFRLRWP